MATTSQKLTLEEFERLYSQADRSYEFWYGEAIPKGMPTWIHGLLQKIIMQLLDEAGLISASEVELRIDPNVHPKPDIIATKAKPRSGVLYPTEGLDVAVEIISEDDKIQSIRERCRLYQAWKFGRIYLVDSSDRSVIEWKDGALIPVSELAGIPVERIWRNLDEQYSG